MSYFFLLFPEKKKKKKKKKEIHSIVDVSCSRGSLEMSILFSGENNEKMICVLFISSSAYEVLIISSCSQDFGYNNKCSILTFSVFWPN